MRQGDGDPIAPSLFILAEEVLSRGLTALAAQGKTKVYHVARGCTSITHLHFAGETILLTNGSKTSLSNSNLMKFLASYEKASGQRIHKAKSGFMVSPKAPPPELLSLQALQGSLSANSLSHIWGS